MAQLMIIASFAALVVVNLLVPFVCLQELPAINVLDVSNKLEYAYDHPGQETKLTFDDMMEAYKEYESWDTASFDYMRRSVPFMRLLADFALIPLDRALKSDSGLLSDPALQKSFIDRLKEYYFKFRPIYYAEVDGPHTEAPKTEDLLNALLGKQEDVELTSELVQAAYHEYKTIDARLEEITTNGDVYAKGDELELAMNYLNRREVKKLYEIVFPQIDYVGKEKENIKKEFKESLNLDD